MWASDTATISSHVEPGQRWRLQMRHRHGGPDIILDYTIRTVDAKADRVVFEELQTANWYDGTSLSHLLASPDWICLS